MKTNLFNFLLVLILLSLSNCNQKIDTSSESNSSLNNSTIEEETSPSSEESASSSEELSWEPVCDYDIKESFIDWLYLTTYYNFELFEATVQEETNIMCGYLTEDEIKNLDANHDYLKILYNEKAINTALGKEILKNSLNFESNNIKLYDFTNKEILESYNNMQLVSVFKTYIVKITSSNKTYKIYHPLYGKSVNGKFEINANSNYYDKKFINNSFIINETLFKDSNEISSFYFDNCSNIIQKYNEKNVVFQGYSIIIEEPINTAFKDFVEKVNKALDQTNVYDTEGKYFDTIPTSYYTLYDYSKLKELFNIK